MRIPNNETQTSISEINNERYRRYIDNIIVIIA